MGRRSRRLVKPEDQSMESGTPVKDEKIAPVKEKKKKKNKKHKKNKENRGKGKEESVTKDPEVFQRKRDDGSTSLAILTSGQGSSPGAIQEENKTPVTLGMLLGKVRAGTATLGGFREDRRNIAKPMYPIYYGGYSSHGPTHDSTFANMTKDESVMVGPYFDFRNLENEGLIRSVCASGDYSATFVDHLLDLFSGKEVNDIVSNNTEKKVEKSEKPEEIDFDLLKTLENDGIDMSFMSTLQAAYELRQEEEMKDLSIDEQLALTAHLIDSLANAQSSRLSAPPPSSLSMMVPPTEKEIRLADRVVSNLTQLTAHAKPGTVVDMGQVRRAMGVHAPILTSPFPVPNTHEEVLANGLSNGGVAMECL